MLFSIIITTYNYEKYICQAIDSALNQSFEGEYEVIVVDDCSTDETSQILDQYNNTLIRIVNKLNQGIEASVNKGIEASSGEYIVRLDADDYMERNFLEEVCINLESGNMFYYGNYTAVSNNNTELYQSDMIEFNHEEVLCRGDFLASGTVYPKKALLDVGMCNEQYKNCGLENYELVLALIENGCCGKFIAKNLFFYRRHDGNLSQNKTTKILQYGKEMFKRRNLGDYKINQYHPYLTSESKLYGLSAYVTFNTALSS